METWTFAEHNLIDDDIHDIYMIIVIIILTANKQVETVDSLFVLLFLKLFNVKHL